MAIENFDKQEQPDNENSLTGRIYNKINPADNTFQAEDTRIEIVNETRKAHSAVETIEKIETKNGNAAAEAQEGDFGQRSYASPDFGKD